jgi:hypothetical protein
MSTEIERSNLFTFQWRCPFGYGTDVQPVLLTVEDSVPLFTNVLSSGLFVRAVRGYVRSRSSIRLVNSCDLRIRFREQLF